MKISKLEKIVVLKDGSLIDPFRGTRTQADLLIEKGKIAAVGKIKTPPKAFVINCRGLVISPGFCDLHVHFREPGREDQESLQTGSRAALAGGFTHVNVMPNTVPPLDTPESIRFIIEKAQACPVKINPIGAVTKNLKGEELAEMGAMIEAGAVAFSDDGMAITNSQVMRNALEYSKMFKVPIINHAEDEDLKNAGVMNEGLMSTELGLTGNPGLSEAVMVHRDLELAELCGARLHVPHVSTAGSIAELRVMKQGYDLITAEVTPHHLYFNDQALKSYNTNLKVAPPIRSETDRKALLKALKDGTVDCIATDHAPHTIEEKEAVFDLAPFGMIGLESCFGAVHKVLVKEGPLTLEELIQKLTVNPRKIMGYEIDLLAEGTQAEIVILDPHETWEFKRRHIQSRSCNSPFLGEKLNGRIKKTISKGIIAEVS
ncbi:MAG: dihydroorotase [Candidatus Neomarinimicrobiota bacterium]